MICDEPDPRFVTQHRRFTQAWQEAEPPAAPWARLKRATVCWWKHRTRKLAPGMYHSSSCRACFRRTG